MDLAHPSQYLPLQTVVYIEESFSLDWTTLSLSGCPSRLPYRFMIREEIIRVHALIFIPVSRVINVREGRCRKNNSSWAGRQINNWAGKQTYLEMKKTYLTLFSECNCSNACLAVYSIIFFTCKMDSQRIFFLSKGFEELHCRYNQISHDVIKRSLYLELIFLGPVILGKESELLSQGYTLAYILRRDEVDSHFNTRLH